MVISPMVNDRAQAVADELGVEVYSYAKHIAPHLPAGERQRRRLEWVSEGGAARCGMAWKCFAFTTSARRARMSASDTAGGALCSFFLRWSRWYQELDTRHQAPPQHARRVPGRDWEWPIGCEQRMVRGQGEV